jgi:hypothetical protein
MENNIEEDNITEPQPQLLPQPLPKQPMWLFRDGNFEMMLGLGIMIVLVIGGWWLANKIIDLYSSKDFLGLYKMILFILACIPIFLLFRYFSLKADRDKVALQSIHTERNELQSRLDTKLNIFSQVQLNLNQLQEYYIINTSQAKNSFYYSVYAIIIGLGVIVISIALYYFDTFKNITLTTVSTISGILIQFIGGAYFVMYKKSISQLNFFYIQLLKTQDIMLAINIAETFDDTVKKVELKEKIAISLLDKASQPNINNIPQFE